MTAQLRPAWFPDWSGQTCIIVASGPSAASVDLTSARGKARFIAINESWRLAPWADVLYGCDQQFWHQKQGVKEFEGLKVSQDALAVARYPQIKRVVCDKSTDALVLDKPGTVGWGGNSGLQAINLAVQFGAKKIILVGYDMRLDRGLHWHGKHSVGMNNPVARNVERWCRAVDATEPVLRGLGIEAANCSTVSNLRSFTKMSLAEALAGSYRPEPMSLLAIGPEIGAPAEISNFSGVFACYLRRELLARGVQMKFIRRPDRIEAEQYYAALEGGEFDHAIAFGSRHFDRIDGEATRALSSRIRGAVCQFNDSPLRESHADLTFVCKGQDDAKNKVIGWAADPQLCAPAQSRDVLRILIDHPDYVSGRGDVSDAVVRDAERFKASSLWRRQFKSVEIATLGSPKNNPRERTPFDVLCAEYSTAHLFLLTHPESVGLSVIESATAGALPVLPDGFMDKRLLETVRRIEYGGGAIPWPLVLKKIDPKASRERAIKETWSNVAGRLVAALKEFRK